MSDSKWDNPAYVAGWKAGMWGKQDGSDKPSNPYLPYAPQYKLWEEGYSDGLRNWDMAMDDGG